MEMLSSTNKTLVELQKEIIEFAGVEFFQDRVDIELNSKEKMDEIIDRIDREESFINQKITNKVKIDGIKLYLEDGYSKILIRKSGTEPLLRFYIESNSKSEIQSIKDFIEGYVYILK